MYDKRNTPALGKNFVRALCTDANGTLWIGGLDGVLTYRDETVRRAPALPGDAQPSVMALLCAPDGAVCAGGAGGSVQRIDAAGASALPGWHQQTTRAITALAWSAQHSVLIGSHGDGLFECAAGQCSQRYDAEDLPGGKVTALFADASGETLIGLYAGGVYRLTGTALERPEFAAALPPGQIWSMLRDRQNNLWVAVQEGSLLHVNAQGTAQLVRRDDVASIFPRVLFESRESNLWVGSIGSGLLRLSNQRVLTIGVSEGLSEDMVWSVLDDAHGSIWIGTDGGGVNRFADGALTHWKDPDQPLVNVVTAAAAGDRARRASNVGYADTFQGAYWGVLEAFRT